jgi:hypothetical protein
MKHLLNNLSEEEKLKAREALEYLKSHCANYQISINAFYLMLLVFQFYKVMIHFIMKICE